MTERSQRFHARINVERVTLDIVNSSDLCRGVPLAGLSLGAIRDWSQRATGAFPDALVVEVNRILTEVARRTGLLADNSRAIFDTSFELDQADLHGLHASLTTLLRDSYAIA